MHPVLRRFRGGTLLGGALLSLLVGTQLAFALECKDIKQMTQYYLRTHLAIHDFSQEISQRTLQTFIKLWDPGKMYFLQEDIEAFQKQLATNLPKMIEKSDCSGVNVIFARYAKRFEEIQALIPKLIDAKHDFTVDEFLDIDRKSLPYAQSLKEIEERWRKRIKFQHLQLLKSIDDDKKVREKLLKRYELVSKRQRELTTDDVYEFFMDSFSTALDPHSDYFSPAQLEEFRISTRLSLEGIGALLHSEDGVTSIQSLVPGGAAEKSGQIKVDDKIVAVAQGDGIPTDVIDMDLKDVVKLIRGPGGTEVKLTIRRDGKEFVVPIVREKIQLKDRAAKSKTYKVKVENPKEQTVYNIGVIDLPSFYMDFEGRQANKENFRSSSRDMKIELENLYKQKVDGVIVDLRSNGGGSLDEAINVAGLLNGSGPVVQIKAANAKPYVSSYNGAAVYAGPLVLLIDRQSASASEILASAIKDYGRGLIVGDSHTFGKGTVQNLNDLEPKLGAIKVTISKFFGPSGDSTQNGGVTSHIVLPSISEQYEIGEKHYDYALPWEKVEAVKHSQFGMVEPYLTPLKMASAARVKNDKGFKEVQTAIVEYEKNKQERLRVSLRQATKEEKAKEEQQKKKQEELEQKLEKDAYGNVVPRLEDDIYLQEAINIATDYIRLLSKKELARNKILVLQGKQSSAEVAPVEGLKPEAAAVEAIENIVPQPSMH